MKAFIAGPKVLVKLDDEIEKHLSQIITNGDTVLVGDANGVDRLAQEFLLHQKYLDVIVYASNGIVRHNIGAWPVRSVEVAEGIKGFAFYTAKDQQMAADADYGFMVWNGKSKGTLNNIINLTRENKKVTIYFTPRGEFYQIDSFAQANRFITFCSEETRALFRELTSRQCH